MAHGLEIEELETEMSKIQHAAYCSLVVALVAIVLVTISAPVVAEPRPAKVARQNALAQQRRIIYNDDAGELQHPGADTV